MTQEEPQSLKDRDSALPCYSEIVAEKDVPIMALEEVLTHIYCGFALLLFPIILAASSVALSVDAGNVTVRSDYIEVAAALTQFIQQQMSQKRLPAPRSCSSMGSRPSGRRASGTPIPTESPPLPTPCIVSARSRSSSPTLLPCNWLSAAS